MLSERLTLVIGNSNNNRILHFYQFPDLYLAKASEIFDDYETMTWGLVGLVSQAIQSLFNQYTEKME